MTGSRLAHAFRAVLPDLSSTGLMIEPQPRGTAPALAWAAWEVAKRDPDAVLISLHADHMIRPESSFVELVRSAAELAYREDLLFTFAVPPTRPETGYGYIEPGDALRSGDGGRGIPRGLVPGKTRLGDGEIICRRGPFLEQWYLRLEGVDLLG